MIGLKLSPYLAAKAMLRGLECIYGDTEFQANVFHWSAVRHNLPGLPLIILSSPGSVKSKMLKVCLCWLLFLQFMWMISGQPAPQKKVLSHHAPHKLTDGIFGSAIYGAQDSPSQQRTWSFSWVGSHGRHISCLHQLYSREVGQSQVVHQRPAQIGWCG